MRSLDKARKWAAFEKQSMVVCMTVLPADGGSPVMKSRAPGVDKCWSRPEGDLFTSLFLVKVEQVVTFSLVSLGRGGHQKKCWRKVLV